MIDNNLIEKNIPMKTLSQQNPQTVRYISKCFIFNVYQN